MKVKWLSRKLPHEIKQLQGIVSLSVHGEGSDRNVPGEDILPVHLEEDNQCTGYVTAHGVHFDQGRPNLSVNLERRSHQVGMDPSAQPQFLQVLASGENRDNSEAVRDETFKQHPRKHLERLPEPSMFGVTREDAVPGHQVPLRHPVEQTPHADEIPCIR